MTPRQLQPGERVQLIDDGVYEVIVIDQVGIVVHWRYLYGTAAWSTHRELVFAADESERMQDAILMKAAILEGQVRKLREHASA
jgi:hypothetical protein